MRGRLDRRFLLKCGGVGVLFAGAALLRPGLVGRKAGRESALDLGPKRTTPPPRVDVREALPELAGRARTTVRLHPRRLAKGETRPAGESKLGGTFLWPADEPWPKCTFHEIPWVGVLQLRAADFPELAFRPGTDLLQLLWCPQSGHGDYPSPEPVLVWRDSTKITRPLAEFPRPHLATAAEREDGIRQSALEHDMNWLSLFRTNPKYMRQITKQYRGMPLPSSGTWLPRSFLARPMGTDAQFEAACREAATLLETLKARRHPPLYAEESFLPRPCRLFPERVVEYPSELTEEERRRLASTPALKALGPEPLDVYESELGVADGTKLGGYVRWSQGPREVRCARGHLMAHLLSIASCEWDASSRRRWLPAEERKLYEQMQGLRDWNAVGALHSPAGMTLGDAATKYVFICRECDTWPVKAIMQD